MDENADRGIRTEQCVVCGAAGSVGRDGSYVDDGEGTVLFVHDSCAA